MTATSELPAADPRAVWRKPASYSPFWDERAKIVVSLLGKVSSVCDIGCGAPQTMRRLLPEGTRYHPADLEKWTPDTETCDLNAGLYPVESLRASDACLMIGVIEYLNDPAGILKAINEHCSRLIVSYHPIDARPDNRHSAWVQNISEGRFLEMTSAAGWKRCRTTALDDGQMIYDFQATIFSRLRRWTGRR